MKDALNPVQAHKDVLTTGSALTLEWLRRLQRVQSQAWSGWKTDLGTVASEAHDAQGPQDLATLQVAFAAEQWARALQSTNQAWADWFDVQTLWMQGLQSQAGECLHAFCGTAQHTG